TGYYRVGRRLFPCHGGHAHGPIKTATAIAKSCNVFFYEHGIEMGPDVIASEARRMGFGEPTGIELPHESRRTLVPDPAWKRQVREQGWPPATPANASTAQGDIPATPLKRPCYTAPSPRGRVHTPPSLIHVPNRPPQRSE